jgi:hypothetical protein
VLCIFRFHFNNISHDTLGGVSEKKTRDNWMETISISQLIIMILLARNLL